MLRLFTVVLVGVFFVACGTETGSGTVGTVALGVTCGGKQCKADETCCVIGSTDGTCAESCESGAFRIRCDGPEDCTTDAKIKCVGRATESFCSSGVEGTQKLFCHDSSSCPTEKSCQPITVNNVTYGACL